MKRKTIIKGTIILTIASLISRILGFVNRIYLSNLIGAEGMGLYQLVFPVYMICYTFCCSGLFIAISKLTSAHLAKGNKRNAIKTVFIATSISTAISLCLAILLYLFSDYIAIYIIHEKRISYALKIIAVLIPFSAICHSLKGYFYGIGQPKIPAIAMVFEQIVRITIIYFLSANFMQYGLEYACNAAVVAMVIGEAASCIYIIIQYKLKTKHIKTKIPRPGNASTLQLTKLIMAIAIPLTTNRLITTLLSSFETILIPTKLGAHGYSHSYAISIYGTLTGMALPLIFFPTVLTSSASLMLLSSISDAHAKNQHSIINFTVTKTIKYSLLLGIIFTFFFLLFGQQLGIILYNEEYVGTLLVTLAFLCPFLYLTTTLSSILNGIEKHMITFRNSIIGLSLRIIFIYSFIPVLGIKGYLYGLILSLFVVASLDIFNLIKYVKVKFDSYDFIIKPSISALLPALILRYAMANNLFSLNANSVGIFILYMSTYFILTILFLFITRTLTFNELHPK